MPRLFILVYVSLACIGASAAAVAGYTPIMRILAGWLFPSVVLGVVAFPLITMRRLKHRVWLSSRVQMSA